MTCALCSQPIASGDALDRHHPVYRSQGRIQTEPMHKACHVALHRSRNDFAEWGRRAGQLSALNKQWSFNLRNVRTHPVHDINRQFNRAFYAQ
jgi:hypothetical protein